MLTFPSIFWTNPNASPNCKLMDPTQTSRLLVYRKRRDQQTRQRGKQLEEEYTELWVFVNQIDYRENFS